MGGVGGWGVLRVLGWYLGSIGRGVLGNLRYWEDIGEDVGIRVVFFVFILSAELASRPPNMSTYLHQSSASNPFRHFPEPKP